MADFNIICEFCREELSGEFVVRGGRICLEVERCKTCIEESREEGLAEGRDSALDDRDEPR